MARWEEDNLPPLRLPSRNVGLGVGILVISIMLLVAIVALGHAGATVNPDANQVSYWCPNGGVKYDPASTPFTVPDPPDGFVWSLLVLKAGSEESANPVNETFVDPVPGQAYSRTDAKSISHVILCQSPIPTTTTAPTTTGATTTAATTTQPSTTLATTTTVCDDCGTNPLTVPTTTIATTTTAGTTTTPTTTPRDVTTTATTVRGTTVETTLPTTTTVAATTSTTAPTTTVAPVALVPAAAVTPAPTTLPVTGSESWWLVLCGVCLIALGLLIIAWTRPA